MGPYLGYSYKDFAAITVVPGQNNRASTKIYRATVGNVPSDYMGALARMYKNGALCRSYGYVYNADPSYYLTVYASPGCGSGALYDSRGVVKVYRGNGQYSANYTYQSPELNG